MLNRSIIYIGVSIALLSINAFAMLHPLPLNDSLINKWAIESDARFDDYNPYRYQCNNVFANAADVGDTAPVSNTRSDAVWDCLK